MSNDKKQVFRTTEQVKNAVQNLLDICENQTVHPAEAVKKLAEDLSEQPVITKEKHLELIDEKNKRLTQLAADNNDLLELVKDQSEFFEGMDQTLLNIEETTEELKGKITTYKTPNIVAAINQVTKEVRNIEKNTTVGEGRFAFNAVSDKDVKYKIGQAMERAGLAIIPTSITPQMSIDRWEENFNGSAKRKKEVFTEVQTKYLLMHESGQSIELSGYGHGVDSMDKSAGKATTYALKYALLYLFMVPTGKIDDAENTKPQPQEAKKQGLNDEQFKRALEAIGAGNYSAEELKSDYSLTEKQLKELK